MNNFVYKKQKKKKVLKIKTHTEIIDKTVLVYILIRNQTKMTKNKINT